MSFFEFGVRAHDYGCAAPEELAGVIAGIGAASVQLALGKALSCAPPDGGINSGFVRRVRRAFDRYGIGIAVLGCYINPVHPDRDERGRQLARFEEHLRYAADFGAAVGTETGSIAPDCGFHPDTQNEATFSTLCASVERLLTTAEKCGAVIALEAVADTHTISSPARMRRLLAVFKSPALKVIYDPVNLIPSAGLACSQSAFFNEAFSLFGGDIAFIHLKDFKIEAGKKAERPPCTGDLDAGLLLKLCRERKPGIDILLENSNVQTIAQTINYLQSLP